MHQSIRASALKTPYWALKKIAQRIASNSIVSDAACPTFKAIPSSVLLEGGYSSQLGQDYVADQILLGKLEHGVFVDIGVHNGRDLSNSYFFESVRGWTGLCIEPNPEVFELLTKNRKCQLEQLAVGDSMGTLSFEIVEGDEMLSGVSTEYNRRHQLRIRDSVRENKGFRRIINVEMKPIQSLLDAHGFNHVDLLSIDTEGSELSVLRGLDFESTRVSVIVIERNYESGAVPKLLKSKGFTRLMALGFDDIYVRDDLIFARTLLEEQKT